MTTEADERDTRRARSVEEIDATFGRMLTDDGLMSGLSFELRSDDVVISSFAKCGTTWLQQIVHGLRSGGDMNFDDISRVVPWIEFAHDSGIVLDTPQPGHPRAFKSHLEWDHVPKGGRYIVSLRDPRDAALSSYRFFEGWLFEPGSIDLETFVRERFIGKRGYYTHLMSWWPRRDDDNVLLLGYEHMKTDLGGVVARVADFIGLDGDPELLATATEQATLAAMTANKSKYDEVIVRELSERRGGLPPGGQTGKVATGQTGGHRDLFSSELSAAFQAVWDETIRQDLGLPDYDSMLAQLATT